MSRAAGQALLLLVFATVCSGRDLLASRWARGQADCRARASDREPLAESGSSTNQARRSLLALAAPEGESGQPGERKRELIFKAINFAILAGVLGYVLRKPAAAFFMERSASIRKNLEEGRKALEASERQIESIEEQLGRLEEEIRAFREAAVREMKAERERLRQSTRQEEEKILESVRAQVDAATRAGILEVKKFAAQEALRFAEGLIRGRLDDSNRRTLVRRFVEELTDH